MDRLNLNQEWQSRKEQATARGVGVMTQVFAARAKNAEIWDVEGKRYIDFAGGIGVLNTGHCHPKVIGAVEAQLARFTHTCWQVMPYPWYVELAEKMNRLTPGAFAKKTIFFSTGAEAIENSIKIARTATGRSGVIAFSGAFHGRTMLAMALTGKVAPYKAGFGPFPPEIYHAPFPIDLHGTSVDDALAGIERLFKADIDPARVAAIVIEPVQGEGGFYVAPPELLRRLRELCDAHGMLLIADEVQTGFARTGRWFAMEHAGVEPDIIVTAKSLAGGFPLSAVTGRADVMDAAAPGGLGGTYAGNPVAIAAALMVIDVIESEQLVARADRLGNALRHTLDELRKTEPRIAEVRGLGAMIGVEFADPYSGAPDAAFAKRVQANALDAGLLLLTCGIHFNVIRFLMPLTIPDPVFTEGLQILERSIEAATAA
ncbi:MAG: 4-aminobutyrate--2-oxoglutarate transaminase [Betaproteobacteria bacterium]|nr:MAG: 4-aminobutyrate--2-oxoglutarate transaminase [Betaproteobacteria bacterium]